MINPKLEAQKKARAAAKENHKKKTAALQDTIIELGNKSERAEPGSDKEKSILRRRAKFINEFKRSK
jgi:hypothetical protein